MSALALALKRAGYEVTGSDVGIYPPISTYLKDSGVDYYVGWHPDRVLRSFSEGGKNDCLVVVGNVAGSTNPEWLYVQENNIPYKSYPEVVAKFFIKPNSIVCAGTYGKTSTTTLLAWILLEAGMDPSYMFGGLSQNDIPSASISSVILNEAERSEESLSSSTEERDPSPTAQDWGWSVVEGDEYKSSRWDNGAKFFHYKPTHLLLTACQWDHADVYPTEEAYFEAFEKLVKLVPKDGLIVANEHVTHITNHISHVITYGQNEKCDYKFYDIKQNKNGIEFKIMLRDMGYVVRANLLGNYNAENITGAFAMAHQIGIEPEKIISAITKFKGIKRRLEKRYEEDITVIDDIAHSPDKAKSALGTLREIYDEKIIAIFEPNSGNRQIEAIPGYDNKFISADEVIIPRLTHIKQDPTKPKNLDGQDLTNVISKTHNNVKYINDDEKLINHLVKNTNNGDVIIFLGSHGFRGMIDELINSYQASKANKTL